jgi:hypothetical protein
LMCLEPGYCCQVHSMTKKTTKETQPSPEAMLEIKGSDINIALLGRTPHIARIKIVT